MRLLHREDDKEKASRWGRLWRTMTGREDEGVEDSTCRCSACRFDEQCRVETVTHVNAFLPNQLVIWKIGFCPTSFHI